MKVNRRRKRKSKMLRRRRSRNEIRAVKVPAGVDAKELVQALKKDKFFARLDRTGKIVTNAPLK